MARTSAKTTLLSGLRDSLPFLLVIGPFAMLFGVVGSEAGLNIAEVMGFTVLVIAGAAQFTAVTLMQENAPTLVIILTALAVNLRMAMYSAALLPHLGSAKLWQRALVAYGLVDQSYAISQLEYDARPKSPISAKLSYFAGTMMITAPVWYAMTYIGAVLGAAIPEAYALDFALPITFLALIAPALKSPGHIAAALVSVALTLGLAWVPYSLGLVIAAAFAMAAGVATEIALERRA